MKRTSLAWVFVSHSVKDLEWVRAIRDELERRGAQPLLFFLKALEDNEELRVLLRREITARRFFILCDSESARASHWVREEWDYVQSLHGKRIEKIDFRSSWDEQLGVLDELIKSASVFLSYSHHDWPLVRPWADFLREQDLSVWTDIDQIGTGQSYDQVVTRALQDAADNGYLIAFNSQRSLQSPFCAHEIGAFMSISRRNGRIILLDLEPIDHAAPPDLLHLRRIPLYAGDEPTNRLLLLKALGLD